MTSWPMLIELNVGETVEVDLGDSVHTIVLNSVTHVYAPDDWIVDNPSHRTLQSATVTVTVDGELCELVHRPYQLPETVVGLRLYVETTREWATACNLAALTIQGDVRLSIQRDGASWGPETLRFPILNYRWRSASYNNTWAALVPYNLLYYHRGEDFGAIPDLLPVVAISGGEVVASPVPTMQGSNVIVLRTDVGVIARYAHMNIETIDSRLVVGTKVQSGQVLGQTGCTWDGARSQWADPHLHVAFSRVSDGAGVRISPYPSIVEAYLRDYPDPVLPVAGGYYFTTTGGTVTLDGSRTIVRAGEGVSSWIWQLHDGRKLDGVVHSITYDQPGQYAETLVVRTAKGDEARDTAHVRVYDSADSVDPPTFGWAYHMPVRGIVPGMPVHFWNRLVGTAGEVCTDFGDGSPVEPITDEAIHVYQSPGVYTTTIWGQGAGCAPVMARVNVVVEASL